MRTTDYCDAESDVVAECCRCGRDMYSLRGQWADEALCSPCLDEAEGEIEADLRSTQEIACVGNADLLTSFEEHFERLGGWLECPRTELYATVEMAAVCQ